MKNSMPVPANFPLICIVRKKKTEKYRKKKTMTDKGAKKR